MNLEVVNLIVQSVVQNVLSEEVIHPDWKIIRVQNRDTDPDNEIPDGQWIKGFHDEWNFIGIANNDEAGNTIYPPKYITLT